MRREFVENNYIIFVSGAEIMIEKLAVQMVINVTMGGKLMVGRQYALNAETTKKIRSHPSIHLHAFTTLAFHLERLMSAQSHKSERR